MTYLNILQNLIHKKRAIFAISISIAVLVSLPITIFAKWNICFVGLIALLGIALYFSLKPKNGVILYLLVIAPIYPTLRNIILKVSDIPGPVLSIWQDMGIYLLIIASLLRGAKNDIDIKFQKLDIIVLSIFLLSVYGAVVSQDIFLSIYGFRLTYLPICFYFIVRLLHYNYIDVQKFTTFLINTSFLIAIIGMVLYFIFPNIYFIMTEETIAPEYYSIKRMYSIFWSPVVFGSLMALNTVMTFTLINSENKTTSLRKTMLRLQFFIFCFCLALSMSRGSWLFAVTGIFTCTILKKSSVKFLFTVILILLVMFCFFSFRPFYGALKSAISTKGARYQWAFETIENIKRAPFGVGLGKAGHVAARFAKTEKHENIKTSSTDSWYLKIALETGIWSLGLFLMFMLAAFFFSYKAYLYTKIPKLKAIYLGIMGAFIGFSAQGIGSNVWDFYMVAPIFWVLLGFVGSYKSMEKDYALYNNH